MKNVKKVVLIGLVILIMAQPIIARSRNPKSEPSRNKNLFAFRADRKFVGSQVEVLYANGEVLTSQTLKKRKMLIDFSDMQYGSYTIRVRKGNEVQEFTYEKK
jgi:hypothetical protein